MKILFLSAYLPGRGLHGGSSRIFEILHYLHRHHDITLLTFMNRHDDNSRLPDLRSMCRQVEVFHLREKRPFYLFPFEPFIDYENADFRQRLRALIKQEQYDLVQFEYVQMGIFRDEIRDTPMFITEHEINFLATQKQLPLITNPLKKLKAYYDSLQMMNRELPILQQMDKVICMNQPDADSLKGYVDPERLLILPHGVDTNYFRPMDEVEEDPVGIGFFGAYHHYPNVDAVLHFVDNIFPLIKERIPAAHFYVIGIHPPPQLEALNKRADITVTGFVPDIRDALARCRVIVAPVRLGLGMRVKVLEAMALGKAVVATELACAGLDMVDGQHAIINNEDGSFAESVCYLLQDRICGDCLGEEARKLVETDYDYQKIGQRLETVYREFTGQ